MLIIGFPWKERGGGAKKEEEKAEEEEGEKEELKKEKTLPFPYLQQNHSHSFKYCYGQVVSGKYQRWVRFYDPTMNSWIA